MSSKEKKSDSKPFDWNFWKASKLPPLEEHSRAKLEILREYLVDYILICCGSLPRGVPNFQIYLIDGFSGGGQYDGEKLGSPLVMLQAVNEAKFRINQSRTSPIIIDAHYIFIDESKEAVYSLESVLKNNGYGSKIGDRIRLVSGCFEVEYKEICDRLRKLHPRGGARALFFLDQCGYSKVRPQLLREINKLLPKAEFIVNFAISWLTDFLNDSEGATKLLKATGLNDEISVSSLLKSRSNEGRSSWAWTVESKISEAYRKIAGINFFSPFYVHPQRNHRGYWLLHLAPHPKARQAMVSVMWRKANRVRHFGKSGLEILSYKPEENELRYLEGTMFDNFEKEHLTDRLLLELPKTIEHLDGNTSYKLLLGFVSNQTNADEESIAQALQTLHHQNEIVISGKNGGNKRSPNFEISGNDIIIIARQKWFPFA